MLQERYESKLRDLPAIQVLEALGSGDARFVLAELAKVQPEARHIRAGKVASEGLGKRTP